MAQVKMPTGETVEMPDNPTPEQLDALSKILNSPQATGTTASLMRSNPGTPGGSGQPAAPTVPGTPQPAVQHTPWGPTGSTLRAVQQFLEQGPAPDNPTVQRLARGTGLAARALVGGVTSTSAPIADAVAGVARMAGANVPQLPSQAQMNAFPTPNTTGEKIADFGGQLAAGSMGDPLAALATQKFAVPAGTPRQPTPKEQTVMDARSAGYRLPPSQGNGSTVGKALESVAGKDKLKTALQVNNQNVTNDLARQEASLVPNSPLTTDTLNNAMNAAYQGGYEPLAKAGTMTNGRVYRQALDNVLAQQGNVNASFPGAANPDIANIVDAYRVPQYDAGHAVESIKNLRGEATDAYRQGDSALARAKNGIADALEQSIELNLNARGKPGAQMLSDFQDARKAIAKQNVVKRALVEGSGDANALTVGRQFAKRPGYMTDGLKTVGQFANTFGDAARLPKTASINPWDYAGWGGAGALGGVLGGPGVAGGVAAAGAGRYGLRRFLASEAGQRLFVDPKLQQSMLSNPALLRAYPSLIDQSIFGNQP